MKDVPAGDIFTLTGIPDNRSNRHIIGPIMVALGWYGDRTKLVPGRRIYRKGKLSTRAR